METPLNAREFLQRFHLPQLVRLSSASGEQLDQKDEEDLLIVKAANNESGSNQRASLEHQRVSGSHVRVVSPNQSNTSISSSFIVVDSSQNKQRQHEKSDWTYRAASSMPSTRQQASSLGGRSEQNLNRNSIEHDDDDDDHEDDDQRGFRSFQIELGGQSRQQQVEEELNGAKNCVLERRKFRSIPDWSTIGHHTASSVRRESFVVNDDNDESKGSCGSQLARKQTKKSVEFQQQKQQVFQQKDARSSKWLDALQSIRLTPPSKRPALSKLQLNQPFLLYKAYKKLELCAYVIDLKNEVNEKSGDPIYFPQNYPGKFFCCVSDFEEDFRLLSSVYGVAVCVRE